MKFPMCEIQYSTSYTPVYLNGLGEFWVRGVCYFCSDTDLGLQENSHTIEQYNLDFWTSDVQTMEVTMEL